MARDSLSAAMPLARARMKDVSQLVLCGNVSVTAQTNHLLCEAGLPVVHLSMAHWFYGITQGMSLRNAYDRAAQFAVAARPDRCLTFARDLVAAKEANQRTLLRRNGSPDDRTLRDMNVLVDRVASADGLPQLLGIEENLAAHYFRNFAGMLRPRDLDAEWDFARRNRRPPRDRINALLSFGYEARPDHLVTHPVFDYRCSWRSVIRLQARLFSRWLRGDIPEYQSVTTR